MKCLDSQSCKTFSRCWFHTLPHKWNKPTLLVTEVFPSLTFMPRKCRFHKEPSCFVPFGLWLRESAGRWYVFLFYSIFKTLGLLFMTSIYFSVLFHDWLDHLFFFPPFIEIWAPFSRTPRPQEWLCNKTGACVEVNSRFLEAVTEGCFTDGKVWGFSDIVLQISGLLALARLVLTNLNSSDTSHRALCKIKIPNGIHCRQLFVIKSY